MDLVDEAIKATEKQTRVVDMLQSQRSLPGGRPMIIAMPKDATDFEWLAAVHSLLEFRNEVRVAQEQAGQPRPVVLDTPQGKVAISRPAPAGSG